MGIVALGGGVSPVGESSSGGRGVIPSPFLSLECGYIPQNAYLWA